MVVLSPCDPLEVEQATKAILDYEGPVYMRTGRSDTQRILDEEYQFEIGKAKILKDGSDVTVMGCGVTTGRALEAAKLLEMDGISVRVVNMSTIKPIDSDMVIKCADEMKGIVTVEDHNIFGGLGSAVAEVLVQHNPVPMEFVGVQDSFGESGEPDELAEKYGIDHKAIIKSVHQLLERI
jgi:transketolase